MSPWPTSRPADLIYRSLNHGSEYRLPLYRQMNSIKSQSPSPNLLTDDALLDGGKSVWLGNLSIEQ